jgi:chromodomain-helicase-DNA-binding protein 4
MFMRHLCEPSNDSNQATFADGVPREGLSRQQVLNRIGIMSLIRRKVQEFESINGHWSMPEMQQQQNQEEGGEKPATKLKEETGDEKKDESANDNQGETSLTEMLAEVATEKKKAAEGEKDKQQQDESDKTDENKDKSDDQQAKKIAAVDSDANKENSLQSNPITALKSTGKIKYVKSDKPEKLGSFKFMFNIADGGFTELHTLWQNEQRTVLPGKEYETWHRLHDYWLLSGIVMHGYSRWQDIQIDPRFSIIQEPFNKGMSIICKKHRDSKIGINHFFRVFNNFSYKKCLLNESYCEF